MFDESLAISQPLSHRQFIEAAKPLRCQYLGEHQHEDPVEFPFFVDEGRVGALGTDPMMLTATVLRRLSSGGI
jgi:hypothetical protein